MPVARISIYANKFVAGGVTYDKASGGPFRWTITKSCQVIREHLDNPFPVFVQMVDGAADVMVEMKDVGQAFAIGDELANCTVYSSNKDGEEGIAMGTLIVSGVQRGQDSPSPGSMTVEFTVETTDGADPDEEGA